VLYLILRLFIMIVNIGRARASRTTKAPFKTVIYSLFETLGARRPLISQLDLESRPYHNYSCNNDNISLIQYIGCRTKGYAPRLPIPQSNTTHIFIHDDYIIILYLYTIYVELTTVD